MKIPDWVFKGYGLPVESRNFSYVDMLNKEGLLVDHWRKGSSVPDISRQETQLWFYYLACSYINVGCEAFHLGQIELIGMNDPERDSWTRVITKIREYARTHARRHWVLLDAHTPYGGMVRNGVSLLDFNSFPLRIKEIPSEPYKAELAVNHLDALYKRAKGVFPLADGNASICHISWSLIIMAGERSECGGSELPFCMGMGRNFLAVPATGRLPE